MRQPWTSLMNAVESKSRGVTRNIFVVSQRNSGMMLSYVVIGARLSFESAENDVLVFHSRRVWARAGSTTAWD